MQVGIDMVYIPEFQSRMIAHGGIERVFSEAELTEHTRVESLAGVFAAKEACMKTIGKKINWLDISVAKNSDGKPLLTCVHDGQQSEFLLSISHEHEYAIAIVILV